MAITDAKDARRLSLESGENGKQWAVVLERIEVQAKKAKRIIRFKVLLPDVINELQERGFRVEESDDSVSVEW